MKKIKLKNTAISILFIMSMFIGSVNISAANYVLRVETPHGIPSSKYDKWAVGFTQPTASGHDYDVYSKLTLTGVGDVFCYDPLRNTIDGAGDYTADALSSVVPSEQVRIRLGYISALGFKFAGDSSDEMRWATQIRLWQEMYSGLVDGSTIHAEIQAKINEINTRLRIMETNVSFDNQTITLNGYGREHAITLTDTTGTFSYYLAQSISVVHTEKNGNSLKIWAEKGDSLNVNISYDCLYLMGVLPTPLVYKSPTSQGVGCFVYRNIYVDAKHGDNDDYF